MQKRIAYAPCIYTRQLPAHVHDYMVWGRPKFNSNVRGYDHLHQTSILAEDSCIGLFFEKGFTRLLQKANKVFIDTQVPGYRLLYSCIRLEAPYICPVHSADFNLAHGWNLVIRNNAYSYVVFIIVSARLRHQQDLQLTITFL